MLKKLRFPVLVCIGLTAFPVCAQGVKVSQTLILASQGTSKGLGLTQGNTYASGQIDLSHGSYFAGLKAFNMDNSSQADHEKQLYVGKKGKLGAYTYGLIAFYRVYEGAKIGYDDDIFEFEASVSRQFQDTTVKGRIVYTPDHFGPVEAANWYEVGLAQALGDKTALSLNLASRQPLKGKDYLAWNLGASYSMSKNLMLDLRYYDTNHHERGEPYRGRMIASLSQKF